LHEEKRLGQGNMKEKDCMDQKKETGIGRVKKGGNQDSEEKNKEQKSRRYRRDFEGKVEICRNTGKNIWNGLVKRVDPKVSGRNYREISL